MCTLSSPSKYVLYESFMNLECSMASASHCEDSATDSDTDSDDVTSVVIDIGSYMTKAGFAGDDAPKAVIPTTTVKTSSSDNLCLLHKASNCKKPLLRNPIEKGVVQDWDGVEKLLSCCFQHELCVESTQNNVLLTGCFTDTAERMKIAEVMFEKFNVPGLYIGLQAIMALYSTGRTTGVVVDSGYERTTVMPIHERRAVLDKSNHLDFGGKQVSAYLGRLLAKEGIKLDSKYELDSIKEHHCFVNLGSKAPNESTEDCTLFDGRKVTLKDERFYALEPLFTPQIIGSDSVGLHTAVKDTISKCFPVPHPKLLYPNIVLTGGNTLFEGLDQGLKKQITEIMPQWKAEKILYPIS